MKILFWNTNRNENINEYIISLVEDNDIDVLVLAEYGSNENELNNLLARTEQKLCICNTFGCDRIKVWSNYLNVMPANQNRYYSIQVFPNNTILCGTHLMSDMRGNRSDERLEIIQEIMNDLQDVEGKMESAKIIIIGDFNEMPYERGCLNANGFHGLPVLGIDDKKMRTVNQKEYRKFYNPMWNFFGDFTYPPGTYYLNQSKLYSPMWYILDQVIFSKECLDVFKKESLRILTNCSHGSLTDENMHPNEKISDHFPIMCEIVDK